MSRCVSETCLSVCLSVYLSVRPSVCLSSGSLSHRAHARALCSLTALVFVYARAGVCWTWARRQHHCDGGSGKEVALEEDGARAKAAGGMLPWGARGRREGKEDEGGSEIGQE